MRIEQMKEEARRHEQKEEWREALQRYTKVIDRLEEEEQPDISLYNRVGDLYIRLGEMDEAVEHYEEAVELYMDSELPNNAIAVCKKVVRNAPSRHSIYLKMGQIRAYQGFLTDARQSFLTYAERMQAEGEMEEAFRALIEFADLAPDDEEIRIVLASQLESHDRIEEAVQQYREAYERLIRAGRDEEAEGLGARIQELDPEAPLPSPEAIRAGEARVEEGEPDSEGFDPTALSGEELGVAEGAGEEAGEEMEAGLGEISLGDEEEEEEPEVEELEVGGLEGFDIASDDEEEEAEELPTFSPDEEAEELAFEAEEEELAFEAEEAEELGAEAREAAWEEEAGAGPEGPLGEEDAEEAAPEDQETPTGFELGSGISGPEEEEEEEAEPLPFLSFDDDEDDGISGDEDDGAFGAAAGEIEDDEEPLPSMSFDDDGIEAGEEELEVGGGPGPEGLEGDGLQGEVLEPEAREEEEVEEEVREEEAREAAWEESAAEERLRPAEEELESGAAATPETEPAVAEEPPVEEVEPEEDPEELRARGETSLAQGEEEEGFELLERAHAAFAAQGSPGRAVEVVRTLNRREPENVERHQRGVEYAYRTRDDEILVSAFLDLARCLEATGAPGKALSVYQQILDTRADHEEALAALERLDAGDRVRREREEEVASSEEYVDLGSLVLDEEEEEKTTRFVVAAEAPSGDEDVDFSRMLDQFKKKVSENVAVDDIAAHYDLGTAYKEMGLLDEAISEFQAALRASKDHLPTYEMLGQCFMEKGEPQMAVRTLKRALEAPFDVEDELLGIYYFLGRACEAVGDEDGAREHYEKVFALDINFQDVTERLRRLR